MSHVVRPVRRRLVFARERSVASESVFCEQRGLSVAFDACKACAYAQSWSRAAVVCFSDPSSDRAAAERPSGVAALGDVTLVRGDVPASALSDLHQEAGRPLPVLAGGDRFLGFLGPGYTHVPRWPWTREAVPLAADLAAGAALQVRETEPLGHALRLMASRGARVLALVDNVGIVQGVLLDLDAMRALRHR